MAYTTETSTDRCWPQVRFDLAVQTRTPGHEFLSASASSSDTTLALPSIPILSPRVAGNGCRNSRLRSPCTFRRKSKLPSWWHLWKRRKLVFPRGLKGSCVFTDLNGSPVYRESAEDVSKYMGKADWFRQPQSTPGAGEVGESLPSCRAENEKGGISWKSPQVVLGRENGPWVAKE